MLVLWEALCIVFATSWEEVVEPWETASFNSGTVNGLSDLDDLRRQSCGCDGDWLVMGLEGLVTVLDELLGVVGLGKSFIGGGGGAGSL